MVAGERRPREARLADPGTTGTLSIGDIPVGTAEKRPLHAARATAARLPGQHEERRRHAQEWWAVPIDKPEAA